MTRRRPGGDSRRPKVPQCHRERVTHTDFHSQIPFLGLKPHAIQADTVSSAPGKFSCLRDSDLVQRNWFRQAFRTCSYIVVCGRRVVSPAIREWVPVSVGGRSTGCSAGYETDWRLQRRMSPHTSMSFHRFQQLVICQEKEVCTPSLRSFHARERLPDCPEDESSPGVHSDSQRVRGCKV